MSSNLFEKHNFSLICYTETLGPRSVADRKLQCIKMELDRTDLSREDGTSHKKWFGFTTLQLVVMV